MNKVRIANNLASHLMGQSDGIIFTHITDEDTKILKKLCEKYNKQIEIHENYYHEDNRNEEEQKVCTNKVKQKKMWVHKGSSLKKILPEELEQYKKEGWNSGRK